MNFLPYHEHCSGAKFISVFGKVFIHFTFLGLKKVKINVFDEKNIFWCIFIKLKCRCVQTGPGNLKHTKHLKFDIRQFFYTSVKNEKIFFTFFEISEYCPWYTLYHYMRFI